LTITILADGRAGLPAAIVVRSSFSTGVVTSSALGALCHATANGAGSRLSSRTAGRIAIRALGTILTIRAASHAHGAALTIGVIRAIGTIRTFRAVAVGSTC
jgi:hypothetical protein